MKQSCNVGHFSHPMCLVHTRQIVWAAFFSSSSFFFLLPHKWAGYFNYPLERVRSYPLRGQVDTAELEQEQGNFASLVIVRKWYLFYLAIEEERTNSRKLRVTRWWFMMSSKWWQWESRLIAQRTLRWKPRVSRVFESVFKKESQSREIYIRPCVLCSRGERERIKCNQIYFVYIFFATSISWSGHLPVTLLDHAMSCYSFVITEGDLINSLPIKCDWRNKQQMKLKMTHLPWTSECNTLMWLKILIFRA